MAVNEVIELKINAAIESANAAKSIGQLRRSLFELQSVAEDLDLGSDEFKKVEKQIAQTSVGLALSRDRMEDLKESVSTLTGTPVERLSSSFKLLRQSIFDLDFDKFKTGINGIGQSFDALGKQLLANPLLLLAAVITGIVVAVVSLMDSLGLLQPIFDGINAIIGNLVSGFKELTNWIGLTNDEFEKGKVAAEQYATEIEGLNKSLDQNVSTAQREIAVLKAKGASLEEIRQAEIKLIVAEKNAAIDRTNISLKELQRIENLLASGKLDSKQTEENLKLKLKVQAELEKAKKDEFDAETRRQTSQYEFEKNIAERNKNLGEQEIARRRKAAEEAVKIVEQEEKLKVLKTEEGSQQRIEAQINELNAIFEVRKKFAADLKITELELNILDQERLNSLAKLRAELEKLGAGQFNLLKGFDLKNLVESNKTSTDELIQQGMLLSNNYAEMQQKLLNGYQSQVDIAKLTAEVENSDYQTKINNINSLFDLQSKTLMAQQALEITAAEETGADVEMVREKYRLLQVQNEQKKADLIKQVNKDIFDEGIKTANGVISAFGAFSDFMFENQKKNLQEGTKEAEAAAKKEFEVRKRMAIASAIISGISGVVNILSAPTTLPDPIGAIYKGVQIAALAITTAAQIGKISSQQYESTSSSIGGGGSTAQPQQPSAPSFNLFGQGNQANVTSAQPTTTVSDPNGNVLRVIAEVSETEITAVQMRNRRYYNSSEL